MLYSILSSYISETIVNYGHYKESIVSCHHVIAILLYNFKSDKFLC